MKILLIIFIPVIIVVVFIIIIRKMRRPKKIIISNPVLGIFDLMKGQASAIIQEDMKAMSSIFSSTISSNDAPPKCNVLFLYGSIDKGGNFENTKLSLRKIISETGALIVIVASENNGDSYVSAGKQVGYGYANLVMTIQRKGVIFTTFFTKLFMDMMKGTTMPVAWVKLNPQIPGVVQPDAPGAIFACEVGQISFK